MEAIFKWVVCMESCELVEFKLYFAPIVVEV